MLARARYKLAHKTKFGCFNWIWSTSGTLAASWWKFAKIKLLNSPTHIWVTLRKFLFGALGHLFPEFEQGSFHWPIKGFSVPRGGGFNYLHRPQASYLIQWRPASGHQPRKLSSIGTQHLAVWSIWVMPRRESDPRGKRPRNLTRWREWSPSCVHQEENGDRCRSSSVTILPSEGRQHHSCKRICNCPDTCFKISRTFIVYLANLVSSTEDIIESARHSEDSIHVKASFFDPDLYKGTIPYTSGEIMSSQRYFRGHPSHPVFHDAVHDLESFFWVLIHICSALSMISRTMSCQPTMLIMLLRRCWMTGKRTWNTGEAICSAARFNTCSLDMVHFLQIEGMSLIPVRQHRPYFFHSNFKQMHGVPNDTEAWCRL